ncbi:MAG: hypothetical protein H6R16_3782 [Proteobacteria bacterium]|nr:hypothetical protein [Pseudomonadota bacterium]
MTSAHIPEKAVQTVCSCASKSWENYFTPLFISFFQ